MGFGDHMKKLGCKNICSSLVCCLLVLLSSSGILSGQTNSLKLNGIFTENMVLQRDADLPIYGTADEGENVTANFPLCNLFNKDGLPAGPLRSDDFEMGSAARADRMKNAEKKQKEGSPK